MSTHSPIIALMSISSDIQVRISLSSTLISSCASSCICHFHLWLYILYHTPGVQNLCQNKDHLKRSDHAHYLTIIFRYRYTPYHSIAHNLHPHQSCNGYPVGQFTNSGASSSSTVIVILHSSVLPAASTTVQVNTVVPTGNSAFAKLLVAL